MGESGGGGSRRASSSASTTSRGSRAKRPARPSGLEAAGPSDFINAVLQVLAALQVGGDDGVAGNALTDVVKRIRRGVASFAPVEFRAALEVALPDFCDGKAHDPFDFLTQLIDAAGVLHFEMKKLTRYKCTACGHIDTKVSRDSCVVLPVVGGTFSECVSGMSVWRPSVHACSSCHAQADCLMSVSVRELGDVVVMVLDRLGVGGGGNRGIVVEEDFAFDNGRWMLQGIVELGRNDRFMARVRYGSRWWLCDNTDVGEVDSPVGVASEDVFMLLFGWSERHKTVGLGVFAPPPVPGGAENDTVDSLSGGGSQPRGSGSGTRSHDGSSYPDSTYPGYSTYSASDAKGDERGSLSKGEAADLGADGAAGEDGHPAGGDEGNSLGPGDGGGAEPAPEYSLDTRDSVVGPSPLIGAGGTAGGKGESSGAKPSPGSKTVPGSSGSRTPSASRDVSASRSSLLRPRLVCSDTGELTSVDGAGASGLGSALPTRGSSGCVGLGPLRIDLTYELHRQFVESEEEERTEFVRRSIIADSDEPASSEGDDLPVYETRGSVVPNVQVIVSSRAGQSAPKVSHSGKRPQSARLPRVQARGGDASSVCSARMRDGDWELFPRVRRPWNMPKDVEVCDQDIPLSGRLVVPVLLEVLARREGGFSVRFVAESDGRKTVVAGMGDVVNLVARLRGFSPAGCSLREAGRAQFILAAPRGRAIYCVVRPCRGGLVVACKADLTNSARIPSSWTVEQATRAIGVVSRQGEFERSVLRVNGRPVGSDKLFADVARVHDVVELHEATL